MQARTYSFMIIFSAVSLLIGTVTANIVLNPQGVFWTNFFKAGATQNWRVAQFRNYRANPTLYDALFFASSRGGVFDLSDLARRMQVSAVANFMIPGGTPSDQLPIFNYVLRDKAERSEPLRAVFLLLDADILGQIPRTNRNMDSFLPPELTGEHPARFWLRHLASFQYRNWVEMVAPRVSTPPAVLAAAPPQQTRLMASEATAPTIGAEKDRPQLFDPQPYLRPHLEMLASIVALCRKHHISLTVAFSPLSRENGNMNDRADWTRIIELTSHVVPVWDFGEPAWLSDRPDLWHDASHFRPAVATMMLDRIFGPEPTAPFAFGFKRGNEFDNRN